MGLALLLTYISTATTVSFEAHTHLNVLFSGHISQIKVNIPEHPNTRATNLQSQQRHSSSHSHPGPSRQSSLNPPFAWSSAMPFAIFQSHPSSSELQ